MDNDEHISFLTTIPEVRDVVHSHQNFGLAQVRSNVGVRFFDNYDHARPGWSSTVGPSNIEKGDYATEYGVPECKNNEKMEELTSSWMNDPNSGAVADRMGEFDQ
tara:strand:+ start:143 stop:457 length:315 start_codon:yes stop_codon:yes gene_type:complete